MNRSEPRDHTDHYLGTTAHGVTGRLFQPGSVAGLARCVHLVLEDPEAGRRARESAEQRFPHAVWSKRSRPFSKS